MPSVIESDAADTSAELDEPSPSLAGDDLSLEDLGALLGEEGHDDTDDDGDEPQSHDSLDEDLDADDSEIQDEADAADETDEPTKAAKDGEADEDEDDDLDEDAKKARASFNPKQQRVFDREVAKVKRKAREAATSLQGEVEAKSQELESLTAEVERLRTTPPAPVAPTPTNPLAGVDNVTDLDKQIDQARNLRRWAVRHPQGGVVVDDKGNEIDISEERSAEILAEAEDLIEKHAPTRREFLAKRTANEQHATQIYPWLKDKKAPATVAVNDVIRRYPILRETFPDYQLIIADSLVGMQVRQSRLAEQQKAASKAAPLKGGTKPTVEPRKAPASPAGGTRAPVVKGGTRRRAAVMQRFDETGEDSEGAVLRAILSGGGG
jgi:hypothetical protein